jgi:hypothetical protein
MMLVCHPELVKGRQNKIIQKICYDKARKERSDRSVKGQVQPI